MSESALVLRTVYLPSDLDERLRKRAFNNRLSKNELIRRYLEGALTQETGPDGSSLQKKSGARVLTPKVSNRTMAAHYGATAPKRAAAKKVAAKKVAAKKAAAKKTAAKK
jgi:hypothetical protein